MTMNITSMDGNRQSFRFDLEIVKLNARSYYCESSLYGDVYRIERNTGKVYCNGNKIADTCEYFVY